ncbi:MAG TPA: carboxylate--amine ligase [Hydrogenothermaceae bacterium]|nr:carboxylate--amine ligase [Hydrogenothermaceae bacterium]
MEIKVGISGINAIDNPGPGIGVAKSIKQDKELNARIVGLAYDAMEPGIYMDWIVDKAFIMPYPSSGHEAYIERLIYIKKIYGLDFVIPVLDAELPIYIKYQKDLESYGIKTFLPSMEQFKLRSKDKLEEVAKNIGINFPKTKVVSTLEDLNKAIEEIGFPVMIKGAFYKAYKANSLQEAVSYYSKIVAEWGYPVIIQQVVYGEEMNVVAGGDGEGNSLGMVGIKKSWITELGKIWTGITIKNEKLLKAAKRFIEVYKWKGAFELECIVNVEKEEIYLIEINPRFPAWSYFSTGVGVNIASNIVRKAFNIPININDYEAGKLYIRYTDDFVIDMDKFQQIIIKGEV